MDVFVAGATGTLGRPTVQALVQAGHAVRGMARSEAKAAMLRDLGAESVPVDLFEPDAVAKAVAGSDAVLRLATKIPSTAKMRSRKAWLENDRIRSEGARILCEAAMAAGAQLYVQESIAYVYADGGEEWIDEDAPLDAPAESNIASALAGEREAARFTASGGSGIALRLGGFYAPYASTTLDMIRLARRRMAPVVGDGDFYVCSIHVDDAARAVVAALAAPAGIYNVCDDEPVRQREFVQALADAMGFKRPRTVPTWLARVAAGELGKYLTRSQRVSNRRLKDATGWTPGYPSVRVGFESVAASLKP